MHAHHIVSPSPAAFLLRALLVLDIYCARCLAQSAHAVLTDANFKGAVTACVGVYDRTTDTFHAGEDPASGNCIGGEFGPISTWDTSRVTDMSAGACSAAPRPLFGPLPTIIPGFRYCHSTRPARGAGRPFPAL